MNKYSSKLKKLNRKVQDKKTLLHNMKLCLLKTVSKNRILSTMAEAAKEQLSHLRPSRLKLSTPFVKTKS